MKKGLEGCIDSKKDGNAVFPGLKREIDELVATEEAFRTFYPAIFNEPELKGSDSLVKLRMLCSQLKDKAEINEKLETLAYHLGQLRSSVFYRDERMIKRAMDKFLHDDQTNIHRLLAEIKSFRRQLAAIESAYREMNSNVPLDTWLKHSSYMEGQLKLFSRIQERQNNIALNLGKLFVRMAKKKLK